MLEAIGKERKKIITLCPCPVPSTLPPPKDMVHFCLEDVLKSQFMTNTPTGNYHAHLLFSEKFGTEELTMLC